MRKRIYKAIAVIVAVLMVFANNGIVALASGPSSTEDAVIYSEETSEVLESELPGEEVSDFVENSDNSEDVSEETSEETSEDVSEETSEEISEEASEETSEEVSEETTEEVSEETSDEISEEASEEISEEVSEETSEESETEEFFEEEIEFDSDYIGGTSNDVKWEINAEGTLTIEGTGDWERDKVVLPPWYSYADSIKSAKVNLKDATDLSDMFLKCTNMVSVDLSNLDTSKVTSFREMFSSCSALTGLDLSKFNTSKVTNMARMFTGCSNLTELNISGFNTQNVQNVASLFEGCNSVTSIVSPSVCYADTIDLPRCDTDNFWVDENGNAYTQFPAKTLKLSLWGGDGVYCGVSGNVLWKYDSNDGSLNICGNGDWEVNADGSAPWANYARDVKTAYVSLKGATNLSCMFMDCQQMTSVEFRNFDTSKVTNMRDMFFHCASLENIDLSGFNTAKVKTMEGMFNSCVALKSVDLSKFNTSQVTDMSGMFYDCGSLETLDLGKFNASKVSDFDGFISGCNALKSIITPASCKADAVVLSTGAIAWVDDKGKIYDKMPAKSAVLTRVDNANYCGNVVWTIESGCLYIYGNGDWARSSQSILEPWYDRRFEITSAKVTLTNATNLSHMFYNCEKLKSIDLSGLDTSKVTDMSSMFDSCEVLEELDLSKFNTSKVTDMHAMFSFCRALTTLDLSKFNTSNVTDMHAMFYGCKKIETLDLSKFNTAKVTDMSKMFNTCMALKNLDISKFNTSKVTNMREMFYDCRSLETLDLSKFNTSNVTNMISMFEYCASLQTLDISKFNVVNVTERTNFLRECNALTSIVTPASCKEDTFELPGEYGWFDSNANAYTCFPAKSVKLTGIKNAHVSGKVVWGIDENDCLYICGNGDWERDSDGYAPWHEDCSTIKSTKVVLTGVTDLFKMFYECKSLTSVDLQGLDTSKVICMQAMFDGCESLETLDLSKFNTANVTDMGSMFINCQALQSLNISNFNTSKVTDMRYMFKGCNSLEILDLSKFNTAKVTDMCGMFSDCKGLQSLNISKFNTSKVTDMQNMFDGCELLETLDISKFNVANVTFATDFMTNCDNLTSIVTPASCKENTFVLPDSCKWVDAKCNVYTYFPAKSVKLTGLKNANVSGKVVWSIDDNGCLNICGNGNWEKDSKGYEPWRGNVDEIKSAKVTLTNATDLSNMFCGCSKLTSIDLTGLDTTEVTIMYQMFSGCKSLSNLDLSRFKTSKVTDMRYMFYKCSSLETLDLSKLDTTNVFASSDMFTNCSNLNSIVTPAKCKANRISLSKIWVDDKYNVYTCFPAKSVKLTCIKQAKVSGKVVWSIDDSGCLYIYGNGDWERDTYGYAPWSAKKSEIKSAKVILTNAENLSKMFSGCESLESLDLKGLDTSKVTSMEGMFSSCILLKNIDLSKFNTSKVTNMEGMFSSCISLKNVDLSKFNTSKVTNMRKMFYNCESIENLDVTKFKTTNVTDMSDMFAECWDLNELKVNGFDTKKVTNISGMFYECCSLETLDITKFNLNNVVKSDCFVMGCNFVKFITPATCNATVNIAYNGCDWYDADANLYETIPAKSKTIRPVYNANGKGTDCIWAVNDGKLLVIGKGDWDHDSRNPWENEEITSAEIYLTGVTNMESMFTSCDKLEKVDFVKLDTSKVTSMRNIFCYCASLKSVDLSKFNTSKVTDMYGMFYNCSSLEDLDLSKFKTDNVTDMGCMFCGCTSLKTLKLGKFNTSKLTDMYRMFSSCSSLTELDLSKFNTSRVTDMQGLLRCCTKLESVDLRSFEITGNCQCTEMFFDCGALSQIVSPKVCPQDTISLPDISSDGCGWLDSKKNTMTSMYLPTKTDSIYRGYTITYNLNGGVNNKNNPEKYRYGETLTLAAPTKEGYTFNGWYDNWGTKKTKLSGGNTEVNARWTPIKYTVTFNANGGFIRRDESLKTEKRTVKYDSNVILNVECNKTGYEFTGWNTKADGKGVSYVGAESVRNFTNKNNANVILYAQWKPNSYKITFDSNSPRVGIITGAMEDLNAVYDKQVSLPANAFVCKGYSFMGWSLTSGGPVKYANKASVKNITSGSNITLYAVWKVNTYNVVYNLNGGKGTVPAKVTGRQYGVTGKKVDLPECNATYAGYIFSGWSTKNDGSGEQLYMSGTTQNIVAASDNQTITLYAVWSYRINIVTENGIPYSVGAFLNETKSIASLESKLYEACPEAEKAGFYIAGFATSKERAERGTIDYNTTVKNVCGKTLYPVYKAK